MLAVSILFMPFWTSAVLALAGMFYFPLFWEAVPLFLLSDLLYGAKEAGWGSVVFVSSLISFLFLALIEFSKKRLKFYA